MTLRETLSTLAIATVVVFLVVVAGLLLKDSRRDVVPAIPVGVAEVAEASARAVSDTFEILTGAVVVESRANEADTLRVRHQGEEHVFVLYFVDALETNLNHPKRVEEQVRYFGVADAQAVTEAGQQAAAFVTGLLQRRPFQVLTRWERVEGTLRYYAVVVVESEQGRPENLAELLMRRGYARVGGMDTYLPDDPRDVATYGLALQELAGAARRERAGIWARSSGR